MAADPFKLERFVAAQSSDYARALSEIRAGQKRSHWIWYIFPQLDGLGMNSMARKYGIRSLAEARAYLAHPVLGPRLREITEAALAIAETSATAVFGSPDDLKLRSCATLFRSAAPGDPLFTRLLDKYFQGEPDSRTLDLLGDEADSQ